MTITVEPVVRAGARLGEGPVWDPRQGCLYWVDIHGSAVHRFDPMTGVDATICTGGEVGAVVPVDDDLSPELGDRDDRVRLLAALDRRVVVLDSWFPGSDVDGDRDTVPTPTPTHERELITTLPTGDRANDGKCDPAGRFFVGTLAAGREQACALYRLDARDQLSEVVAGVTTSNGLDWSPDGTTFYYVDTPTYQVEAFDYDVSTGELSERRRFVDLNDGSNDGPWRPDGLTVDAEGGVWVTIARGGQVRRFDPRGRLDAIITLPTQRVTSCAFGGVGLNEMYITSGQFTMTPQELAAEPLAGALFRAYPGVQGKPAHRWVDTG